MHGGGRGGSTAPRGGEGAAGEGGSGHAWEVPRPAPVHALCIAECGEHVGGQRLRPAVGGGDMGVHARACVRVVVGMFSWGPAGVPTPAPGPWQPRAMPVHQNMQRANGSVAPLSCSATHPLLAAGRGACCTSCSVFTGMGARTSSDAPALSLCVAGKREQARGTCTLAMTAKPWRAAQRMQVRASAQPNPRPDPSSRLRIQRSWPHICSLLARASSSWVPPRPSAAP